MTDIADVAATEGESARGKRTLRSDVQGLRGLAVLLVVAFHAGLPLPGGFTGVDVFFVISGFVITRLLFSELQATGGLALGRFYSRRARRLLPALTLVLLVVAALSVALQNPLGSQQDTSSTGFGATMFAANAVLFLITGGYFDAAAGSNPLLHTWTLAVEEQFYFVFPILLLVTWRMFRHRRTLASRRRILCLAVGAAFAISLGLSVWLTYSSGFPFSNPVQNSRLAFFGSPTRAWEFAAGALLALLEMRSLSMSRRLATLAWLAGVTLLAISAFQLSESDPFPGYLALAPVAGTTLVIAAAPAAGSLTRVFTLRWLVWIGDLSYGWYLWHWPAIVFTRALIPTAATWLLCVAAIAALAIAWVSYTYVEQPIRHNKTLVGARAAKLAALCMLLAGSAFTALYIQTRHPGGQLAALITQYQAHYDVRRSCAGNFPDQDGRSPGCTWQTPEARGTILLLGDSQAGQFAEPVQAAAAELGFDFMLASYGGCLVTSLEIHYANQRYDTHACREFGEAWSAVITKTRPALVVLATASGSYMTADSVSLRDPASGRVAHSSDEKRTAYERALTLELQHWARAGVPTLVVHQLPHFGAFDLRECPSLRIWVDASSCGQHLQISVQSARSQIAASNRGEAAAVQKAPPSQALDLMWKVCDSSGCQLTRHGQYLYRDSAHLTVPFALTLTPQFQQVMASTIRAAHR